MKILDTCGEGFTVSIILGIIVNDGKKVFVTDDLSSGDECKINRETKSYKVSIFDEINSCLSFLIPWFNQKKIRDNILFDIVRLSMV